MTNMQVLEKQFEEGMKTLEAAFRVDLKEKTIKIYYDVLKELSGKEFKDAVDYILRADTFFPAIARFKEITNKGKMPVN